MLTHRAAARGRDRLYTYFGVAESDLEQRTGDITGDSGVGPDTARTHVCGRDAVHQISRQVAALCNLEPVVQPVNIHGANLDSIEFLLRFLQQNRPYRGAWTAQK